MELTKFSRNRLMESATRWTVPREYFDPLYNYLVYGFEPGSFWTAVLANDFAGAILHSHPANSIPHLKHVVGWMRDSWPEVAYGDRFTVQIWIDFSSHERRLYLEANRLIYSEQEEVMMALQNVRTHEPFMD
jgi:hypothetical protein